MEDFEGLVIATARMHAVLLHREEEDLAQELRMKVWYALERYDATRSRLPVRNFVFGALTNRIKDMKRDAGREVERRRRYGIEFTYIEDRIADGADHFDGLFYCATHDEVYGEIDEGEFVLPSTVTERESKVLLLLMQDWGKAETALRLGLTRCELDTIIARLRRKLADWNPSRPEIGELAETALAAA